MPLKTTLTWAGVLALLLSAHAAPADALIVTRAMRASTIAEIFIEDGSIRLALEIGTQDLAAFANLMPDPIYERLGHPPRPFAQRRERFFAEDLVLRTNGGPPLIGRIKRVVARRRVKRDEITGEPLANQPADQPAVVVAELLYRLPFRPRTLSIRPPAAAGKDFPAANIGFQVYHLGLPVNDFRYLGVRETLDLDWSDAWYSKFRNRNLRRQNVSPVQAFLYVEPFEVRKEIIIRPRDLQQWVDLGLQGRDSIPVAMQAELKDRAAEFLADKNPLSIDGKAVRPASSRIRFVRRTLRKTGVIDPPEELSATAATLGVIFIYPIADLPREVSMRWELFAPRIATVPAVATDEAGGLPSYLTAEDPVLTWRNFLRTAGRAGPTALPPPRSAKRASIPLVTLACAGLLIVVLAQCLRRAIAGRAISPGMVAMVVLLLACGAAGLPIARIATANPFADPRAVSDAEAERIVSGLLSNVYHAFDRREESAIYDALARSASGELLSEVYLQTRKALEVANSGGARTRVKGVKTLRVTATPLDGEAGFTARCVWNVSGAIGHWGHVHQRTNQYEAEFTVQPVDGVWKITALRILDEQRL